MKSLFSCVLFLATSLCAAQRLPQTAVPESYILSLAPDLAKASFEGDETIHIHLPQPSRRIVLNAVDIEFHEVAITSGGRTQTAKVALDKDKQTATLSVDKVLPTGSAAIHILYSGTLNNEMRGFYLGKDDQGRKYAATQLENTDARRAFPSFDEPAFKATFEVSVTADQGLTVISNTNIASDTPAADGKHTVHFAATPRMSSYLVAIVVGNFEYVEGSADGIPIRVFTSPGKKELGTFALQAAEFNLHFYDQYFGIKYPYGKLDLVGLADFSAGAMENTGCITFREVLLLLDEKNASLAMKKTVAYVMAHEMAHQWFGDLVTMKWWDDKWLNEGFATWVSGKPMAAWKPEWDPDANVVADAVNSLNLDSLASTHAIHLPANTSGQMLELDDAITYGKTAAVLRMLESYLGSETFRTGINAYLTKYSYSNAAAGDFWNVMAGISKMPVNEIMATWVEQPGAPLVSVKTECSAGTQTFRFEQRRYYFDRKSFEEANPELWQIPVCIRPASSAPKARAKCELITKKQQTVKFAGCASWDFINAGGMGFYRSGYESQTVRAMAEQVETALSPAERIMLLADVGSSAIVNREPIGDYLTLAEGLKSDRNDVVLGQLLPQLTYIGERLTNDSDGEAYSQWVRELLAPIAQELGWTPKPGEPESLNALRANLLHALADVGQDGQTQALAHNLAEQALLDPTSVNADIARAAMEVAAHHGDEALYDKVLADLKNAKTPEIRTRDIAALDRFRDPKLVERTLQMTLSPEVRSQDSPYVISAVIRNTSVEKQAWQFVQDHWSTIDKLGGAFASGVIVQAAGSFCDAGMLDEVKTFFTAHPVPAAQTSLEQSIERINNCIDLKAQQEGQLASWLKEHGSRASAARDQTAHH